MRWNQQSKSSRVLITAESSSYNQSAVFITYHTQARMDERFLNTEYLNMSIMVYFRSGLATSFFLIFSTAWSNTSRGKGSLLKFAIFLAIFSAFLNRCSASNQRKDSGKSLEIEKTMSQIINVFTYFIKIASGQF